MISNDLSRPVVIEWRKKDGRLGVGVVTRLDAVTVSLKHNGQMAVYAIDDPELLAEAKYLLGVK